MLVKANNDLADMAMLILETFPKYVKEMHNPIDTAMNIMVDLQGKVEALEAENKRIKESNAELREKAWKYDDLCK